ncbi:MAG: methyltransferase domain-containing protein [Deltaproteobacteria bacterium]|nr:methyltransferase domain-containing protein [Deltaproteobacteria bacterium]
MNLVDMARRGDANLVVGENARIFGLKGLIGGSSPSAAAYSRGDTPTYSGFLITPSHGIALELRDINRWYPFRMRPASVGWHACLHPQGDAQPAQSDSVSLEVSIFEKYDRLEPVGSWRHCLDRNLTPVRIPWPSLDRPFLSDLDLHIRVPETAGCPVFLAINQMLYRDWIIGLAVGEGIELGPGHRPQIAPGPECRVRYLEMRSRDEWERCYNDDRRYEVDGSEWERYEQGSAHDLPAADGSLDFVFSSHLFEHLVNPLGHLEHWGRKLRPHGKVLAIVPHIQGCFDYRAQPSSFDFLMSEYRRGGFELLREHFETWVSYHGGNLDGLMATRFSPHVSFFNERNICDVLQYAVDHLGYAWFHMIYQDNNVDFYFVLSR